MKKSKSILIVGLGNPLMEDDGLGIDVVKKLRRHPLPSHVKVMDCGCDLLRINNFLEEDELKQLRKIIVVDAIKGAERKGQVHRFNPKNLTIKNKINVSTHHLSVFTSLDLLYQLYPFLKKCKIEFIGVEPCQIKPGHKRSPKIKNAVMEITKLILKEVA